MTRHDYLPFGEEMGAGIAGRTTGRGYSQFDGNRKKWAQLERDDETGLDYAQARYYSSVQGRFTSPDEFTGGPDELFDFAEDASDNPTFYADLTNPQSLNKYQYTYNNPLNMVDPDGHCPDCPLGTAPPVAGLGLLPAIIQNPGKALDVVQTVISVVGIVPGLEAADGVNAGISAARGNYGEAAMDGLGALGPVGSAVAVGNRLRKLAGKADDAAGILNRGGRFADLKNAQKSGEVAHHMPQAAAQVTLRSDGPAVGMTKADHAKTRTYGGRGKRTNREDAKLTPRQRLAKDIRDLRRNFGSKYRKGSLQAIDYAKTRREFRKRPRE